MLKRLPVSIFDLHSQVLADYRNFVHSFLLITDERAREFVSRALDEEARLWPDFLVQVSPSTSVQCARRDSTAKTACSPVSSICQTFGRAEGKGSPPGGGCRG